jgi:hypothetical protein
VRSRLTITAKLPRLPLRGMAKTDVEASTAVSKGTLGRVSLSHFLELSDEVPPLFIQKTQIVLSILPVGKFHRFHANSSQLQARAWA